MNGCGQTEPLTKIILLNDLLSCRVFSQNNEVKTKWTGKIHTRTEPDVLLSNHCPNPLVILMKGLMLKISKGLVKLPMYSAFWGVGYGVLPLERFSISLGPLFTHSTIYK